MKRKVSALTLIFALLISAVAGAILVNLATADPVIYLPIIEIKSDGSVVPSTPFIKQDGDVYTLTGDMPQKYSILIRRSNIVFDGAGYRISSWLSYPPFANRGLSIESVSNVTVKDIEVTGFSGGYLDSWLGDVVAENTTNSVFLRVTAGVLRLVNSSFNTIAESNITTGEYPGLGLMDSNYNILFKNEIARLSLGGEGNIAAKNNITKELSGGGLKNSIIANRITQLYLGSNSTYYANNITRVTITGADNLFYANNFQGYDLPEFQVRIWLHRQPWEEGPRYELGRGSQFWDNGEEGNYWRIHKGVDADDDGITDEPYLVETKYYDDYLKKQVIVDCGIDNYPLMSPFDIESVSFKLPDWSPIVDSGWAISFLSPQNQTYSATDISLNFTMPKSAKFVRFSLDGQANVTITGNTTLKALTYGSHNITLYIDDQLGNTSPSETIYFSVEKESEPFPTALAITVSGASVAVVSIGLLIYFKKRKH
jgi:hypothetical protein